MKTLFALVVSLGLVLVTSVTSRASAEVVQTSTAKLGRPVKLEDLIGPPQPNKPSSTYAVFAWQQDNTDKQITKLTPVFEDDSIIGWQVGWKPTKNLHLTFLGYVGQEVPFIIPEGMSSSDVLSEEWTKVAKKIDQAGREKPKPVALNRRQVDGKTIVYGLWYTYENSEATVSSKTGKIQMRRTYARDGDNVREANRYMSLTAPFPKAVEARPELILRPAPALAVNTPRIPLVVEGDTVLMKPFEVNESKSWITFNFSGLNRDGVGLIDGLTVEKVQPGKLYAEAGLKDGMIIRSVNGVDPIGLTKIEFNRRVMEAFKGDFSFEVSDGGHTRQIVIPREKLRRPSDKTIAAATEP